MVGGVEREGSLMGRQGGSKCYSLSHETIRRKKKGARKNQQRSSAVKFKLDGKWGGRV